MIDFLEVYFYCIFLKVSICIRVLQRNRTNRMCVGVCVCVCVYIYRIPSCSGEFSLCSVKTFNWLDKAHPYYRDILLYSTTDLVVNLI